MPSKLNRRSFAKSSAVWGTAVLAGQSVLAQTDAEPSPNEEIRTAIIGLRNQGRNHIRYHSGIPGVRIVTLCDPDESLFAERVKMVPGKAPKTETDMRRVFDDKNVDCVLFATPNHWHALGTVWACQAGKDVYVEKPATYCIAEGRKMIDAAKKYDRIVQNGTHLRAQTGRQQAIKLLREGLLGDIHMARAFIYNQRTGIGHKPDGPAPQGVDYNLWLGPVPQRPFNPNRFHYNWHWFWDTGNGEIGNNGPHMTDLAIHGLDKQETLPIAVASQGGRFAWNDQGETPNVQTTNYTYGDGTLLTLEIRNLASNKEAGTNSGAIFYGSKGYMLIDLSGRFKTVIDGKEGPKGSGGGAHPELLQNFYGAVRSRKTEDLWAPLKYGHTAAALCHLGNIAYRVDRTVKFDPQTESFPNDPEAQAFVSRQYRAPFVMPEQV